MAELSLVAGTTDLDCLARVVRTVTQVAPDQGVQDWTSREALDQDHEVKAVRAEAMLSNPVDRNAAAETASLNLAISAD